MHYYAIIIYKVKGVRVISTLSLKNINKIYPNGVQAVYDFSLDIKDREFVVFVGPSGCGKSTTLRMIAGFETISTGKLYIDNLYVNNISPKDRNIAMVFQNYALYPHMTVYENLSFALELRKIPCPVLSPTKESEVIEAKENELRQTIKAIKKRYIKNQNSAELLAEYSKLYEQLIALDKERISKMTQKVGIDQETIDELTKDNKALDKTIKSIGKKIKRYSKDEKFIEAAKNTLAQKNTQVEENNKKIEYLKNHEVLLFTKRKLNKNEIDIKINETAFTIDLTKYLFRLPGALSGGQCQRVALGRAIVRNPKVFLMDEPLSNLDAKLRVQTRGEIIKIHKKVNATTVYVTHDQTEAMTMADRIVVMKDGYIQQIGSPQEIYDNPTNKFVASFIGSPAMNFMDVTFDGKSLLINGNKPVKITLNPKQIEALKKYKNKEITLGIRPEKFSLKEKQEGKSLDSRIEIISDYTESLGYETVLYGYINEQKLMAKYQGVASIDKDGKVKLYFNKKDLYFFDKDTSRRIYL